MHGYCVSAKKHKAIAHSKKITPSQVLSFRASDLNKVITSHKNAILSSIVAEAKIKDHNTKQIFKGKKEIILFTTKINPIIIEEPQKKKLFLTPVY